MAVEGLEGYVKGKGMKIAILVSEFPSSSETFIQSQITGLLDRGHDVTIYTGRVRRDLEIRADLKQYNLLDRTICVVIPKNKIIRAVRGLKYILRFVTKKPLPILRSLNVLRYRVKAASFSLLYQIIPFLENGPYDIIHCQFGPNGQRGAVIKEIGAIGGKLITTFHGYDLSKYIKENGCHAYNSLMTHGDSYLPISDKWKDELIRLGFSADKIVVHRMGIDLEQFNFRLRNKKKGEKIRLFSIARFVEKKGLEYGIRAFAKVAHKCPQIDYQIAGDGVLKNKLRQLIEELNLGERVQLLGWREPAEVTKLMEEADIFLAPSVTAEDGDQEGIPVVLMEALAQGLPVLSTLHSGIPELVENGVSGYLVNERDVEALTDRLSYLIDHPERWAEMGKAGRARVEAFYNIKTLNDRLVRLYEQLCAKT